MHDRRILVIGTTPDYISHISRRYPGRALFITDGSVWVGSHYDKPDSTSEIICDLSREQVVMELLHQHLRKYRQQPVGVACYDCEWLVLAARIAASLRLPFPPADSVQLCRNKHLSKARWIRSGVPCPRTELIRHGWQAIAFLQRVGGPIVLKPLSGSGSELTFRCDDSLDAANAMSLITAGLKQRAMHPMYAGDISDKSIDSMTVLAEEFIEGREYSCDFVIDGSQINIVRVAKKIRRPGSPFGTTLAYLVPARLPAGLDKAALTAGLSRAARALGLERAICMVDFIINHDGMFLLELTPRIGGDCLPPLIRHCCGIDMIGLALDFAEGKPLVIPPSSQWRNMVGLRLFAIQGGVLKTCDVTALSEDNRVKEIYLKRQPGHQVVLPPDDYDSWLLGHIVFEPDPAETIETQCRQLLAKFTVDLEPVHDKKLAGIHYAGGSTAQAADSATG